MLITASAACRIIKQKAGEPVETFVSTGSPAAFGAADEARSLLFGRITAVYKRIAPEKCLFFFFIVL